MFFSNKGLFPKPSLVAIAAIASMGGVIITAPSVLANESDHIEGTFSSLITDANDQTNMGQVTSVSQLSDVQPTDWAFQALQSLVERYGCIAGYPDGTFRGNRSATRYEMAAALNACLDNISDKFATKEDLEIVKALQEEFQAELATLRGRVDGLEARTDTLESQQFSTTTKLKGEAIFGVGTVFDSASDDIAGQQLITNAGAVPPNVVGGAVPIPNPDGDSDADEDRVFVGYRARLNLDTSFNGSDRLRVRLQSRDVARLDNSSCGTDLCRLGFDGEDGADVELNELNYRFKPSDKLTLKVAALGGDYKDDVETFNPLKSSGSGALSRFFRVNPVVHRAPGDTTVSAVFEASDNLELSLMYSADGAEDATVAEDEFAGETAGLFGGSMGGLAQIAFTPSDQLKIGAQYAFSRFEGGDVNITNSTADAPTNIGSTTLRPFGEVDTIAHNFGLNIEFQPSDRFIFAGWAGLTLASVEDDLAGALGADLGVMPNAAGLAGSEEVKLINWAANFIFPDLFAEGNRASFSVGQAPYIINGGSLNISDGQNSNFLFEAQYQVKVNKFIKISPGVIAVINANNSTQNDPIFIPVLRTTFKF